MGGGGDAGSGADAARLNEQLQLMTQELGKLRLALRLQGVQVPIIGSFAKGTLSVPETGLALVHAGETITPAGRAHGSDGGSIGDIVVNVQLEGDMEGLGRFVKVKAIEAVPQISRVQGTEANRRRREGRF